MAMTDYAGQAQQRRMYYADFELRQACIATALIGFCIGMACGVLAGWWSA